MYTWVFHIHTNNSYDSKLKVEEIVDIAFKNWVNFLVISDHDSLKWSIQAREYAEEKWYDIEIPIACEYLTDIWDILVFWINKNFKWEYDHKKLLKNSIVSTEVKNLDDIIF